MHWRNNNGNKSDKCGKSSSASERRFFGAREKRCVTFALFHSFLWLLRGHWTAQDKDSNCFFVFFFLISKKNVWNDRKENVTVLFSCDSVSCFHVWVLFSLGICVSVFVKKIDRVYLLFCCFLLIHRTLFREIMFKICYLAYLQVVVIFNKFVMLFINDNIWKAWLVLFFCY